MFHLHNAVLCVLMSNTFKKLLINKLYLVWSALALPTLKIVQPKLKYGAVVLTDNTISGATGYADLLAYLRASGSGFYNVTLPYTNGLEMSVYRPSSKTGNAAT